MEKATDDAQFQNLLDCDCLNRFDIGLKEPLCTYTLDQKSATIQMIAKHYAVVS